MDLAFSDEQLMLVRSLQSVLENFQELPADHRRTWSFYSKELDTQIVDNGFFEAALTPEMGPVGAALVVMETATVPAAVEVGASALIAPHFDEFDLPRPIALISGDVMKAQRYLPNAKCALLDVGDDVLIIPIDPADIELVETIYAYPFGRFRKSPDLSRATRLGAGAVETLRRWWRVSIAAECAGTMQAATDFTVQYVKDRQMFGTTLGTYQAVQHRLAQCHQIATATRFLTLKAAWSGETFDALQASAFAQQHIQKLTFDLHQFNGGMGVTNEHKLHFWTYRFRALQAELGGANQAALETADMLWGQSGTTGTHPPDRSERAPRVAAEQLN
jgi:hypothetical protein